MGGLILSGTSGKGASDHFIRVAENQILCKYLDLVPLVGFYNSVPPPTIVLAPEKVPENDGTHSRPVSNLAPTPSFHVKVRLGRLCLHTAITSRLGAR